MGPFECTRRAVERLCENLQLLRGQVSIAGIDGLVDTGEDYGSIAGILAGREDRVPVPRPVGESRVGE